jgi:hypothetical protein
VELRRRCGQLEGTAKSARSCLILVGLISVLTGCSATGRRGSEGTAEARFIAEAYSFNARLWREGKPNTFKLEVYQTDSLIGLSGRGYLGKGALRGWIRSDSIMVYFPAANELLHESIEALVAASSCQVPLSRLDFLQLLRQRPDSITLPEQVSLGVVSDESDRAKFKLAGPGEECRWELNLDYRRRETGWRIDEFYFDDGRATRLRGSCELYRAEAKVPVSRIDPAPRPDATRIVP